MVEEIEEPLAGSYIKKNIESAISYAVQNSSRESITYTELFEAAGLKPPQWYFEEGFRSVITDFMEAFHFACACAELPPFDAFVVNASGDRANYPGIGYFTVNGLIDPLDEHTSISKAKTAILFREEQLQQIRTWNEDQD